MFGGSSVNDYHFDLYLLAKKHNQQNNHQDCSKAVGVHCPIPCYEHFLLLSPFESDSKKSSHYEGGLKWLSHMYLFNRTSAVN